VKIQNAKDGFIEACNFDIPEMRSINSGQVSQVLCDSSKIKAGESRENNAFPGPSGRGNVMDGGKKME